MPHSIREFYRVNLIEAPSQGDLRVHSVLFGEARLFERVIPSVIDT